MTAHYRADFLAAMKQKQGGSEQRIHTRMLLCRYNGTLHVNIRAPHDMSEFCELQPHPFMPVLRYNLSNSIAHIQRANRYKKQG